MNTAITLDFFSKMGLPPAVAELKFHPTRRWRFDFAFPSEMVALEVEGGIYSGGRHTSAKGFLLDMEKYNAATMAGWRVLRVTPKLLLSILTVQMIKETIQCTHFSTSARSS